jgi:hypothetical protein
MRSPMQPLSQLKAIISSRTRGTTSVTSVVKESSVIIPRNYIGLRVQAGTAA